MMAYRSCRWAVLCAGAAFWCAACADAAPVPYQPAREIRTLSTAQYDISVHKNGFTDVRLTSREPVFANAFPMVWLDGEPEPRPLAIDGRLTGRIGVNDRLGKGQGLLFQKGNCEWIIQAYPTEPFFTVQTAFINTTHKPVRVKMLMPWAIGNPKSGTFSLGPSTNQAIILENGRAFHTNADLPELTQGTALSLWNVAVYNPAARESLIAGFLTHRRAYTQLRIERGPKAETAAFDLFRAECVYDPPVEVAPGGRLESEVLYLSIAEPDPLAGLERFGTTLAAANQIKRPRTFLPHGWDSWNTQYKTDITEDRILAALDFLDKNLKRYGWNHLAVDSGWERGKGDWDSDPAKFPHGMKWLAEQIHARKMTAGIWIDPFTVRLNTPVAQAHPEWLVEPNAQGRELLEPEERILDVTAPGAYEYIRDLFAKIGNDWGFDAVQELDFVYHLLCADHYTNPALTRIEVLQMGMNAVREGLGAEKFITTFTPLPVTGLYANAMRIGDDCAPIWRKAPDAWPWGCVETMTNAARRYYFAPWVWTADPDCAYFGHAATRARWDVANKPELTWDQSLAWLTAAALTGVVKVGDWLPDLSDKETGVLKRLLPAPPCPARPVDLFERQNPCIWSLPVNSPIGKWNILAVFNWDEAAPQTIPVSFARLGLDPDARYTVYGFWQDNYFGIAQKQLTVTVAPGSVQLLGLRRYEDRPMFLATDRHFTQGATDFTALAWNVQDRQLAGTFEGVEDTDYNLRLLVPDGYASRGVTLSAGEAKTEQDGKILKIAFHCAAAGPVTWTAQF